VTLLDAHNDLVPSADLAVADLGVGSGPVWLDSWLASHGTDVVALRRSLHSVPELGRAEHRTTAMVARRLMAVGLEPRTLPGGTGLVCDVGYGERCVALRADLDALPLQEDTGLPFASTVEGAMHACGHDAHTAILMGVAEALAGIRERIPGTVKFIFQPAEETPPIGENGGAKMMIEEGCLDAPRVGAIFGLHITSIQPTGMIGYRSGPLMASADDFRIFVRGTQTHAAMPWRGVDPIVVSSQIVLGLQTIVSRRMNITKEPSVVTVGVFQGGVRHNIIPDEVKLEGTIRSFDEAQRDEIHEHVKRISEMIAASGGAKATVHIHRWYDVTVNHPALTEWSAPTLARIAGEANVGVIDKICGAEDFSFFQKEVPGFFYFMGCTPPDRDAGTAAPNHSPRFYVDEDCLPLGVRTLCALALDWLSAQPR
jgi:amidohydrolase